MDSFTTSPVNMSGKLECDHEEINEQESHLLYFEKNGKDLEAVQMVVLDKKWLESSVTFGFGRYMCSIII